MEAIQALAIALKKSGSYVDEKLDAIGSNMNYVGSVESEASLPSSATKGDVYTTKDTGQRFVYDGTEWVALSSGGYAIAG